MSKLALVRLEGDLEQGVRVMLLIEVAERANIEVTGLLPPNPSLAIAIDRWQFNIRSLGATRIKPNKIVYDSSINQRRLDCQKLNRELRSQFNSWLLSESFRPIRDKWLAQLMHDEVRILIRTFERVLLKLPWHLWDLIEQNPRAEVALSTPESEPIYQAKTPTWRGKVKILAILGDSTGIDIQHDRQLLETLTAETTFLVEPQRRDISDYLWEQDWDILFFAGHSNTEKNQGRIYINQTDSLTLAELRYALRKAIDKGLQLAIFNSCDGMGLAFELQQLHLPQAIVMREPVPDRVAQAFLTYFLPAYARGQSLYLAAREARLRLQGLENEFPGASWLPVIAQNPATIPPTWQNLGRRATELCPYRGLFAFRAEDAPFFYGREEFTQTLIAALQHQSLIAVIGASGSGKSSVIFAGLIPLLRQQNIWHIAAFRPGSTPLHSLAAAIASWHHQAFSVSQLASILLIENLSLQDVLDTFVETTPVQKLLLVVDQFEELYTQCQNDREQQIFLARLLQCAQADNIAVVLTLRSDFLGQVLADRPFADALQQGTFLLGAMNRSELQAAIAQPAALLEVAFEEGLTERMLQAVSASASNLPLLEFALQELWAKRRETQLTHFAYDEIGGVEAAIARYAERVYSQLSELDKVRSQHLFLQLVYLNPATEPTRRLATRAEVGDVCWELAIRLASERLVVTSQDRVTKTETVEIVHEALIREWRRLQQWIDRDRDFRFWQQSLRSARQQWQATGRDAGVLLRGKQLNDAQEWLQNRSQMLIGEQDFIAASLALREQERQQHLRQRQRTTIGLTGGLVGALVLATIAGTAWWRTSISETNTRLRSLAASSAAILNSDVPQPKAGSQAQMEALIPAIKAGKELRKAIGIEASTRTQVIAALQQAVYGRGKGINIELPECMPSRGAVSLSLSLDRKTVGCANYDGTVRLWERATGKKVNVFRGDSDWTSDVQFSPDGRTIASGSVDGTVKLRSRATGRLVKTLKGRSLDEISSISFSPDGKTIAAGNFAGTIVLWNLGTGEEIETLSGHLGVVKQVHFSPDSQTIASVSDDGTLKVWHLQTDKELKTLTLKDRPFGETDVRFSFDSQKLIYQSKLHAVTIWDIQADREINTIEVSARPFFSPDGKIIASGIGSGNNTVILRDVSTGSILRTLSTETGKISPIALRSNLNNPSSISCIGFSADSKLMAVASSDRTMTLWNPNTGKKLKTFTGLLDWTGSISFSPDGKLIATAGMDADNRISAVKLWDISTGKELKTLIYERPRPLGIGRVLRFSPDSKTIAAINSDRTAILWDVLTGKALNMPIPSSRKNVQFSLNSSYVATADPNGTINLKDSQTGRNLTTLLGHSGRVNDISSSPDGKTIVSGGTDGIRVWDRIAGKQIHQFGAQSGEIISVSFSPDGQIIAAADTSDRVSLWRAKDGKELKTLLGQSPSILQVGFSNNGQRVFAKSRDGSLEWWNTSTGEEVERLLGEGILASSFSFSNDGKTILAANWNGTIRRWNIATATELETLKVRFPAITSADISSDGKRLTAATLNNTVKLWEIATGREIHSFKTQSDLIEQVLFSPDGKAIATLDRNNTAQLWNVTTGAEINIKTQSNSISDIAFSPDRQTVAFAYQDGTTKLWNFETGQEIATLKQHSQAVSSVSFSTDGNVIASNSVDGVKLWDAKTGRELKTYADTNYVSSVFFSADRETLVLANLPKLMLLNFNLEELLNQGCREVRNYLKNSRVPKTDKNLCDFEVLGSS